MDHVETLTQPQFAENLNTSFRLHVDDATTVDLELVEVSELREGARHESFSLLFRGPLDFCLPQRSYRIDHQRMGTHDLFLVPVAREQDGFRYETIFNRLKER